MAKERREKAANGEDSAAKKEKKRSRHEGEDVFNGVSEEEARREKKRLKKEKKRERAEGRELSDGAAPAGQEGKGKEGKEEKKQKKKKAAQALTESQGFNAGARAKIGDHDLADARPPIVKALFKEHPDVAAMSQEDVDELMSSLRITVENCSSRPVTRFDQCGFTRGVLKCTEAFLRPSPIQATCWPVVLSGRDMVGVSATGSGKTLAFGLPALMHILAQRKAGLVQGKNPKVLVLSPTRELAMQIAEVLTEAGEPEGITILCCYGGVPKRDQQQALRKGVDVVVGTPGRLQDLIEDSSCRLSGVSYFVLDEADRMLDLGFKPAIEAIARGVRADRQTLMFSATWPKEVQELANDFLSNPAKVVVGSQDLAANHAVRQVVEVIDPEQRGKRLLDLLEEHHGSKGRKNRVMVFVLYKKEASRVESFLQGKGWKAAAVHGDASQAERTRAVEAFKAGTVPLLIATDVAARGLDIPDVEVVINYAFPLTIEDYVHRIGRTGRAGKTGVSHTFFQAVADKARAGELVNVLREAKQAVPPELLKFGTHVKKKESKLYGAHFKEIDTSKKAQKMTFDSDSE